MIKIEHPNLSQIVEKHKEACFQHIKPRLDISIDLFNALGNHKYKSFQKSIKHYYGLESNTVKAMFKNFLKKKNKVNSVEVKSAISSTNNACFKVSGQTKRYKEIYQFFIDVKAEINSIVKGDPLELHRIFSDPRFEKQTDKDVKQCLNIIFNYESLVGGGLKLKGGSIWNNYSLTEALDISVCPYCNRNWINTVEVDETGKKITNPQLDHFYSKTDYPLFRLSFFNLIPSCETCNTRLKNDNLFGFDSFLHPYYQEYGNEFRFRASAMDLESFWGIQRNFKLELEFDEDVDADLKKRVFANHDLFKINTIYSSHLDLVSEIYSKRMVSNERYMDMILEQFPDSKLTKEELYRLAFGNYYKEEDFKRRPFAKLTKDIVKQLRLIK